MINVLAWLNENSGGLTALLTAVLVLSTIIYTIASIYLVKMNIKTIKEMQLSRKQLELPIVAIELTTIRNGLHIFLLHNFGNTSALNIKITFSPECIRNFKNLDLVETAIMIESLARGNLTLAPKQNVSYALCGPQYFTELRKVPLSGQLVYTNIFDETSSHSFYIHPQAYNGSLYYTNEFQEIAGALDRIHHTLKEMRH